MKILDLFCGAGGAAMGYYREGFEVVGVDRKNFTRFPFEFHQADAIEFMMEADLSEFDAIHASPPCQKYSVARWRHPEKSDEDYEDFIEASRDVLQKSGKPYIIENVDGAPLIDPILLCGSMVGLTWLKRHRKFEVNFPVRRPVCDHSVYRNNSFPAEWHGGMKAQGRKPGKVISVYGNGGGGAGKASYEARKQAMEIDWMSISELSQAVPPRYTQHIAQDLKKYLYEQGKVSDQLEMIA